MQLTSCTSYGLSLDIGDWSTVLPLTPKVIVSNRPYYHHAKDQSGPVKVRNIRVRRYGKEHEDEQDSFECQRPAVGPLCQHMVRVYIGVLGLTLSCRTVRTCVRG